MGDGADAPFKAGGTGEQVAGGPDSPAFAGVDGVFPLKGLVTTSFTFENDSIFDGELKASNPWQGLSVLPKLSELFLKSLRGGVDGDPLEAVGGEDVLPSNGLVIISLIWKILTASWNIRNL